MEEHYLKLPFALPGGCEHLAPLGGWDLLEKLLAHPQADVIVGKGGTRHDGPPPTAERHARELLAAGYTIGIRHAHLLDPALAELAAAFAHDFAAPIDIHAYITPANKQGFSWHYDAEEVFVLQLRGSKEWWLRKNTVNPWPLVETLPADMRYEREIMPAYRCPLAAGDWLYIPGGYWHRTEAQDAESVSLSVGILAPTAIDAFDFVRQRLVESLRWRQRLPCLGNAGTLSPEELRQALAALFAELGEDLSRMFRDQGLVVDFLSTKAAQPRNADLG